MKTTSEKKSKRDAGHESSNDPLYTLDMLKEAIRRHFPKNPPKSDKMDIKHLWSWGFAHRFRVNWWGLHEKTKSTIFAEKGIIQSCYLSIVADEEGIEITEVK